MTAEVDHLLEIRSLTAGYGKLPILHDIDLLVPHGSLTAVIGPNGAGKTTLMNSIIHIVTIISGEIRFNGKRIDRREPNEIADMGLAYVPQVNNVFPNMTVEENLEMAAHALPKDQRVDVIQTAFQRFPRLRQRNKQKANTLSGGERQMLAIGSALLTAPKLVILDEPTTGLAPQIVDEVVDIIINIKEQGATLIWVVEENPLQVLSVADSVYVMEGGQVKTQKSGRELVEAEDFSQIFLGV